MQETPWKKTSVISHKFTDVGADALTTELMGEPMVEPACDEVGDNALKDTAEL